MANQKPEQIKGMDTNCHTDDLVQAFSYVENAGMVIIAYIPSNLQSKTEFSNDIFKKMNGCTCTSPFTLTVAEFKQVE